MKVIVNVEDLGNGTFDIFSDDRKLNISNWITTGYVPIEHKESIANKVDDAIRLKKAGIDNESILEILKDNT